MYHNVWRRVLSTDDETRCCKQVDSYLATHSADLISPDEVDHFEFWHKPCQHAGKLAYPEKSLASTSHSNGVNKDYMAGFIANCHYRHIRVQRQKPVAQTMARRRADSPDYIPSDPDKRANSRASYQPHKINNTTRKTESSTRRTSASPRKKEPVAIYLNTSESDDESLDDVALRPKVRGPKANYKRTVKLAPLNASKAFPSLSASGLSKDSRPKRQSPMRFSGSPVPGRQTAKPLQQRGFDESPYEQNQNGDALSDRQHLGPSEELIQEPQHSDEHFSDGACVEESVWCGSESAPSESEDELPSPRKLFQQPPSRNPPQPASTQVPPNKLFDVQRGLDALSLGSVTDERLLPASPTGLSCKTSGSRYINYSDHELEDRATLRFSPPRLYSPKKAQGLQRATTPPPLSPSKSKLLSPSKKKLRIPTPPMRPSLDTFWNPTAVNEWHDQYSPEKVTKSPKKSRIATNPESTSPSVSPRKLQSPSKRTKAEIASRKAFGERKHQVAKEFLEELDQTITSGQIAELAASTGGVQFVWSKTLNSTAGRANWRRDTTKQRKLDGTVETIYKDRASIELAEKVIDDEDRLLNVIAHEFCHLANFMVSNIKDQPHGRQFKVWGAKCNKAFADRGVEVTTKHSYQIEYKYMWQCENEGCGAEFKRHSKSIDPAKQRCGKCKGALLQVKPVPRGGGKMKGEATGYAAFVKLHYKDVRAGLPAGATQKEVMEALGKRYRAQKETGVANAGSNGVFPVSKKSEDDVADVARKLEFVVLEDD